MNRQDIEASIDASAAHYGEEEHAVRAYLSEGLQRALDTPNRGPIKFNADGSLDQNIRDAYAKYGFYIFEDCVTEEELADFHADLENIRDRYPTEPDAPLDKHGRPALGADCKGTTLLWASPLSDPLGGTKFANGRHQVKLFEPEAADDAPENIVYLIVGSLQFSEAHLRFQGHPGLLKVAAAIHGDDFVPFTDALFIKEPGLGSAVSWHQDGTTHWESPDLDRDTHGFNYMLQVYGSDPVNGVWVIPGTHTQGKVDIRKMVADAGCERLPDAIPLVCDPGDTVICSRQLVHGSFANTGLYPRVTVNIGAHRRASVLNITRENPDGSTTTYDEDLIRERSKIIGYAIDARKKRYPNETPYEYKPILDSGDACNWDDITLEDLKDYNLLDLRI